MTLSDAALLALDGALVHGQLVRERDILEAYSSDASEVEPQCPEALVRTSDPKEVSAVLMAASEHQVPVTARGAGTGRVGGAVPVSGGIVLSFEAASAIKDIDTKQGIAVVEPGVVTGDLHRAAEAVGLFYPPDPNSWATCTLGGNIATNAGGPRAFKYGVTREYVLGVNAVTGSGSVLQLGRRTRKGVTGYDLTALMVGSEGTLGIVTEATLKLIPMPQQVCALMVYLPSQEMITRTVFALASRRIVPRCVELLDEETLEVARVEAGLDVPQGARAMLLVELDGDEQSVDRDLERVGNELLELGALDIFVAATATDRERVWASRREMSHTLRTLAKNKMSEDVVVPVPRLGELLDRTRALAEVSGTRLPSYGHAGDGNLHVNFLWDDPEDWPRVKHGIESLFREVLALGGTLSGEHGIGVLKAPYLPLEQSPAVIDMQEQIKALFDPKGILNPGKIFPASAKRFHGAC